MFYGEIWLIIPKLSLLPLLIWSTDNSVIRWSFPFHNNVKNLDLFYKTDQDFWAALEYTCWGIWFGLWTLLQC